MNPIWIDKFVSAHLVAGWSPLDRWIVVVGVLAAAACALLGNFLVLRRMSMMGDAISHAVLPGLAAAFLITGSRGSAAMLAGAAVVGILTAVFTQWIHSLGKVEESAAMGVVFTALFAVGLILIVRGADRVDLDPGCVLYGAIELTPLDTVKLLGWEIPRAAVFLGGVLALNLVFVAAFYKELRIAAFDPALATTLGINARLMHYALMVLVAITTVAAFESVGSILVIAMLIVPPAAAHLLTDRYGVMLLLSLVLAALSAAMGHVGAITIPPRFGFADTSTAGMMAVAAGAVFAAAMFFSPRHGIISRAAHRVRLSVRIACEDALGLLYRIEEVHPAVGVEGSLSGLLRQATGSGRFTSALAAAALRFSGAFVYAAGGPALTPAGRDRARRLVRAHRLWESFVTKHFQLPADHVHDSAERTEHFLTHPIREALAGDLTGVTRDPQGKTIPPNGSAGPQEA